MIVEYFYKADATIEITEGNGFNLFAHMKDGEVTVFGSLVDLLSYTIEGRAVSRVCCGEHELINVQIMSEKVNSFREIVNAYKNK